MIIRISRNFSKPQDQDRLGQNQDQDLKKWS